MEFDKWLRKLKDLKAKTKILSKVVSINFKTSICIPFQDFITPSPE